MSRNRHPHVPLPELDPNRLFEPHAFGYLEAGAGSCALGARPPIAARHRHRKQVNMGDDKNKLEYEVQTTLQEAVSYLEELLDGLKQAQVILKHRAEAIALQPSSVVTMSVKAKQKGAKESVAFEMHWKRVERAALAKGEPLRIESPTGNTD